MTSDGQIETARWQRSGPWALWLLAAVTFAVAAGWFSERVGLWSEELSVYPAGPNHAAHEGEQGELVLDTCDGESHLRVSEYRPELALCAGDRTWPIQIASYTAGWIYWPIGAVLPYDPFVYRKVSVVIGLLTLLLGFTIARRMTDAWAAAAGAVATALASPFLLAHSLLVQFELLPLPLLLLAFVILARAPADRSFGRPRAAAAGLLVGLAVAVNIKALFLIAGFALFAWRSDWPARARRDELLVAALAALLPLLPFLVFGVADSRGEVGAQALTRLRNLLDRLTDPETLLEPVNLLTYWTDVAAYGDIASGLGYRIVWWTWFLPAAALGRITWHLVRRLRRRPHDRFAAAMGALVLVYVLPAALLYSQRPSANYAPLHAVFGFATGAAAVAIARAAAKRFDLSRRARVALAAALVALAVAGFATNAFRRGDPAATPLSTNAVAQRAAVDYLARHPGGTVVTVSYNLAGVVDAISGGDIEAVHIGPYVKDCRGDFEDDSVVQACVEAHWHQTLARLGRLRMLFPTRFALSDEREVARVLPALEALESRGLIRVELEAAFAGAGTQPLLGVWDIRLAGGE